MANKQIYLLSGLGADERIFSQLDLSSYDCHFLHWIEPIKDEPISAYAKRMTAQIKHDNPILLGVSFGGIVCQEMSLHIAIEKLLLISSASSPKGFPFYFSWAKALNIHRLAKIDWLRKPYAPFLHLFSVNTDAERQMIKDFIEKTSPGYMEWALGTIFRWSGCLVKVPIKIIHGTKDRTFPFDKAGAHYAVNNGGHLMVLNKAKEVSAMIQSAID
jgi:pimeloyl-ACP methyl ester carboxylesterase